MLFKEEIAQAGKQIEQYQQAVWYRLPRTEDIINKDYQFEGLMDLTKIHEWLSIPNMQFYFCGPLPLCNLSLNNLLLSVLKAINFIMSALALMLLLPITARIR